MVKVGIQEENSGRSMFGKDKLWNLGDQTRTYCTELGIR